MNAHLPDRLSDEMALSIGHAVSAFGSLEEALKRTIFSLTRKGIGDDASNAALEKWLEQMEDIADDSLGTLIDSFLSSAKKAKISDYHALQSSLSEIRNKRNLICHASWRPGEKSGHWHPTFINTKGERFPGEMSFADVDRIYDDTIKVTKRVLEIMQATGIEGELAGDGDSDLSA